MAKLEQLQCELNNLKLENQKQKKIIDSLISRIELKGSFNHDPYHSFQHSVILADQVRDKTDELNTALNTLEQKNQQLLEATNNAKYAHQRFIDAIESISDGFALFDHNHKLIYANQHFDHYWQQYNLTISANHTLHDIKQMAAEHGVIINENQLDINANSWVFQDANKRWLQVLEKETADGGLVVLYKDITLVKQAEQAKFEAAMAEKSQLLQTMVDNLSQGVIMVDCTGKIQIANNRFIELNQCQSSIEIIGKNITQLDPLLALDLRCHPPEISMTTTIREQTLRDNKVIEIRSHRLADGGFVNTYTDITESYLYAKTVTENEQWLRLITDNVPALIAYVGADLKYQFTNKAYDQWYGWQRGQLLNTSIIDSRPEQELQGLMPYLQQALNGQAITFEFAETNAAQQACHMMKSYVPNINSDNHVEGLFVLNWDITESKLSKAKLEQAYQTLEQRVTERTSQLQHVNNQLREEINERRQIESRLLEAKEEAEQANLSKTKFLAAISHDLLQPLNAAQLYTGSLQEQRMPPATRQLVHSVAHSLADVESLIGMLVDISKLDAGIVKADKQSFRVSELLDNIAKEFQLAADDKNIEIRYVPCSSIIYSDSQLLARIIRNLMSNALRYTNQGKVLLGCRQSEHAILIEVLDTGIGIAEEKQQEIFQEFKRIESKTSHRTGLGLGLAIVDKISTVLGHQVSVKSTLNKGSQFSVRVPKGDLRIINQTTEFNPIQSEQLNGARVWVVDNDLNICNAMTILLEKWGCEVVSATNLQGLQMQRDISQAKVEMLIMDYHLDDDQTGTDLAQKINQTRVRNIPTLLLTANRSDKLKREARSLNYAILHKPVIPIRLKMAMIQLLENEQE